MQADKVGILIGDNSLSLFTDTGMSFILQVHLLLNNNIKKTVKIINFQNFTMVETRGIFKL